MDRGQKVISGWTRLVARAVGILAPQTAIRWTQSRLALDHYTGATTSGPNQTWKPSSKSADEMLRQSAKLLRSRARDLIRNYGVVSGAIKKFTNNVVFKGIKPQTDPNTLEKDFREWQKAVRWREKEALICRHLWSDGEILIHYYVSPTLANKGIVPLGVELIECDHLDETIHGIQENGNKAKRGIEYNQEGYPVAYHLFEDHPGDSMFSVFGKKRRVLARDIEHIFTRERASQNRGEPWLTSLLMECKDLSEYKNSERLAARLASAFGIFIKSSIPESMTSNLLGGDGETTISDLPDYLEPARIQPLPVGTEIQTAEVKRPGNNYEPYVKQSGKDQSAALGMSYAAYSNDYTDSSYSSERAARLEERRGYQCLQVILIEMAESPTLERFRKFGVIAGRIYPENTIVRWQVPGWPWVDPDKDSRAAERDLKNGLTSRHKIHSDRGTDYDETMRELEQEKQDGWQIQLPAKTTA